MKYSHESEELNALLGKKVKVTLFDDTTITGILTRAEWKPIPLTRPPQSWQYLY